MRSILQYILKYFSKAVLWRTRPFVIAVTGSVGKSSTKEAVFSVFNHHLPGRVRRSRKNLNTEIGVPLAIIGGVDAKKNVLLWGWNILKGIGVFVLPLRYPDVLVLEMAADRPGDISYLTSLVRPDISIVTAIGETPVHLEYFASREELINEKAMIVKRLRTGGTAVLNGDDAAVRGIKRHSGKETKVVSYGRGEQVDVRAEGPRLSTEDEYSMRFKVRHKGSVVPVVLRHRVGEGAVYAALAAAAAGVSYGINLVEIAEALEEVKTPAGRMQLLQGIKDTLIIDDSYNAAPLSLKNALAVLAELPGERKVAVLGDMKELGVATEKAHREAGKSARTYTDILFLVGEAMRFAQEEVQKNAPTTKVEWFKNSDEAAKRVQQELQPGDVVLVKGSRSMHMERVVEEVKKI